MADEVEEGESGREVVLEVEDFLRFSSGESSDPSRLRFPPPPPPPGLAPGELALEPPGEVPLVRDPVGLVARLATNAAEGPGDTVRDEEPVREWEFLSLVV